MESSGHNDTLHGTPNTPMNPFLQNTRHAPQAPRPVTLSSSVESRIIGRIPQFIPPFALPPFHTATDVAAAHAVHVHRFPPVIDLNHRHFASKTGQIQCLNPADANSYVLKKKGGSGTTSTGNQHPTLPPRHLLNCREFYNYTKSDKRRIASMMIGVTKAEYGIELCLEEIPYIDFARELRPTNLCLQEELLRRAVLANATVLPRPAQWEKEKIVAVLKESYPPRLTKDDVEFLKYHVIFLHQMYCQKKEDVKNKGWTLTESHLRFYHALLERRTDLAPIESDAYWQDVASLMNNPEWIPDSIVMPEVNSQFAKRYKLQFLFHEPLSIDALRSKFEYLRKSFQALYDNDHDPYSTTPTSTTAAMDMGGSTSMSSSPSACDAYSYSQTLHHPQHQAPSSLSLSLSHAQQIFYFQALMQKRGFDPVFFNLPIRCIGIQTIGTESTTISTASTTSGNICHDSSALETTTTENDDNKQDNAVLENNPSQDETYGSKKIQPTTEAKTTTCSSQQSLLLHHNSHCRDSSCGRRPVKPEVEHAAVAAVDVRACPSPARTRTAASASANGMTGTDTTHDPTLRSSRDVSDATEKEEIHLYLTSSRLLLNQFEFYNRLENEWLTLEEKRLQVSTSAQQDHRGGKNTNSVGHDEIDNANSSIIERMNNDETASDHYGQDLQHYHHSRMELLYDDFCQRKRDSLRILKPQLMDMADQTDRCLKRQRRLEACQTDTSFSTFQPTL